MSAAVAISLINIAAAYMDLKEHEIAIDKLNEALIIQKKYYDTNKQADVLITLHNQAMAYLKRRWCFYFKKLV